MIQILIIDWDETSLVPAPNERTDWMDDYSQFMPYAK